MTDALNGLDAHQLLQAFLTRKFPRYIGVRGGDRREWLRAEQDVEGDLHLLCSGSEKGESKAVPEAAAQVSKSEVLEAFLEALVTRLEGLGEADARELAAKSRCVPLDDRGLPDLSALRELVLAWSISLAHEDGDGDESKVPRAAEELIERCQEHSAAREPATAEDAYATLLANRGKAPSKPYGIRETFAAGDWIEHKKFGLGVVTLAHEKIVVRFPDQDRTLIHAPRPAQKIGA